METAQEVEIDASVCTFAGADHIFFSNVLAMNLKSASQNDTD